MPARPSFVKVCTPSKLMLVRSFRAPITSTLKSDAKQFRRRRTTQGQGSNDACSAAFSGRSAVARSCNVRDTTVLDAAWQVNPPCLQLWMTTPLHCRTNNN